MAMVKFTSVEKFIDELDNEFGNLPAAPPYTVLRLTNLFSPISNLGPIRSLTVVATVKVRDDIIRLNRYCSQIWDMEHTDDENYNTTKAIHEQIEKAAEGWGIETRAGFGRNRDGS